MAIRLEPYAEDSVAAVRDFNRRLDAGKVPTEFRFPESATPEWLPAIEGRQIFQEMYLAVDDTRSVRGGYIHKRQQFWLSGKERQVGYFHLPLSEGLVDRTYISVGIQLLRDALARQPLLYCLGMGGLEQPLPRMLKAMGWRLDLVPFLFYAHRPKAVLRQLPNIRRSFGMRLLADLFALSGFGSLALGSWQYCRTVPSHHGCRAVPCSHFDQWVDEVWARSHVNYQIGAIRDSATLRILYDQPASRFQRIQVWRGVELLGWAVLLDTRMVDSPHFANLRVGTIVDVDAVPGAAPLVVRMARDVLRERGVDLLITNQSHDIFVRAARTAGFFHGPSNFAVAYSRALTELAGDRAQGHWTRGDGDGPIHL